VLKHSLLPSDIKFSPYVNLFKHCGLDTWADVEKHGKVASQLVRVGAAAVSEAGDQAVQAAAGSICAAAAAAVGPTSTTAPTAATTGTA
jgi:hypothetical protein